MKNVLLIMHRKILADALTRAMRDDERFQLFYGIRLQQRTDDVPVCAGACRCIGNP